MFARFLSVGALILGLAVPAHAEDDPSVDAGSALSVSTSASSLPTTEVLSNVAQVPTDSSGDTAIDATVGGVDIKVPTDPSNPVSFESSTGNVISIELPFANAAANARVVTQGVVAYDNNNASETIPVVKEDGSLQITSVIWSSTAPSAYTYTFEIPEGATLLIQENGAATILGQDGSFLGVIAPAWALDAEGVSVPTHYELTGSTLTQVVDHTSSDFSYPIVADPWLGIDLISSFKWVSSSQGRTISVAVTPMMGFVAEAIAAGPGWDELVTKVSRTGKSNLDRLRTVPMQQQWACHAAGKTLIGIAGWLGIDKRPTWDLETWLRPVSDPWVMVSKKCNW